MKTTIDTLFYAVEKRNSCELVTRYTGGHLWQRKGDAMNNLKGLQRQGCDCRLLTVKLQVVEVELGAQILNDEREKARLLKEKQVALGNARREILNELKDITGMQEVQTIKTFMVKNLMVPDYKIKVEELITKLEKLK